MIYFIYLLAHEKTHFGNHTLHMLLKPGFYHLFLLSPFGMSLNLLLTDYYCIHPAPPFPSLSPLPTQISSPYNPPTLLPLFYTI